MHIRIDRAGVVCGLLFMLMGCQTYEPAPYDLDAFDRSWGLPDFDGEVWRTAAGRVDAPHQPDVDSGITLAGAEAIALYGNPSIRRARLEAGVAVAAAEHAGRWDDPSFNFDVLRNVEVGTNPWLYGASLGFTIPLSGRLAIAEQQADAEVVAQRRRVVEAEWRLVRQVQEAWVDWQATVERFEALDAHLNKLDLLIEATDSLVDAGEMPRSDARVLQIEKARWEIARIKANALQGRLRLELLKLMGLRPNVQLRFARHSDGPPDTNPITDDDELRRTLKQHPLVAVAAAEHEVAEHALHREIRKQYPDLSIGPAYEHEDAQSRIGIGLGIPLPLLNANREGIAKARAARELALARVEGAYQTAMGEYVEAEARWRAAVEADDAVRSTLLPLVKSQVAELRKLVEIGEVDVLLLSQAVSASIEARLALIDTRAEVTASTLDLNEIVHLRWASPAAAEREDKP